MDPVMHAVGGVTLFDQPGISIRDLDWIHRDQFVHYVELAHALGDPSDWAGFREDLLRAVAAAFGLAADDSNGEGHTQTSGHALQIIDQAREEHDPATDWPGFFDLLWSRRHAIRPDLP